MRGDALKIPSGGWSGDGHISSFYARPQGEFWGTRPSRSVLIRCGGFAPALRDGGDGWGAGPQGFTLGYFRVLPAGRTEGDGGWAGFCVLPVSKARLEAPAGGLILGLKSHRLRNHFCGNLGSNILRYVKSTLPTLERTAIALLPSCFLACSSASDNSASFW